MSATLMSFRLDTIHPAIKGCLIFAILAHIRRASKSQTLIAGSISAEQLDQLLGDCKTPRDVDNLYSQLLQRVINRSLEAEMDVHLEEVKATGRRTGVTASSPG